MTVANVLTLLIFLTAILFSSVGQAGASGYLAIMALCGVSTAAMKPSALVLNVLVASIGTWTFVRAGAFRWSRFWPLALGSVPLAFLGGLILLPGRWYKVAVGLILLLAAYRLALGPRLPAWQPGEPPNPLPVPAALAVGGLIGLVAGLTGTGGGVLLAPLLLLTGWADIREAAGITAAFILATSTSALLGQLAVLKSLPEELPYWAAAAIAGGLIGSHFGTRYLRQETMRRVLALLLVLAGWKLLLF
ncbi:sulfite exporter TauE/SafE family protein [soil metagenome]